MKRVVYTDSEGFKRVVEVPNETWDESQFRYGLRVGPPDLTPLGLNKDVTRLLSNALCDATLVDLSTLNGRRNILYDVVKQVLQIPELEIRGVMQSIVGLYQRDAYSTDL